MNTVITFAANAENNPLNAMAADFWAGEVDVQKNWDGSRWTADVTFAHTQKDLCSKYGVKDPYRLRVAQGELGHPVVPAPSCRDCGVGLSLKLLPFSSRQEFIDFMTAWANAFCSTCDATRKAEQARIRREEEQRWEAEEAQREEAKNAKREKLRKRLGEQYLKDCPECFGVLYLRRNRQTGGMFIACSSYPDCKHREPMLAPVPAPDSAEIQKVKAELATARPCPKCGSGRLRQVNGAYGLFIGCTAYPNCKYTESIPQPAHMSEEVVGRFE